MKQCIEKFSKMFGKKQLLEQGNKLVAEMRLFVGEMKQNVLGRYPKGKVQLSPQKYIIFTCPISPLLITCVCVYPACLLFDALPVAPPPPSSHLYIFFTMEISPGLG